MTRTDSHHLRRLAALGCIGLAAMLGACDGPAGPAGEKGPAGDKGATALTRTTTEAAGSNCKQGGTKIEVGLDTDGNGKLDDNEVTAASTTYICNGEGGGAGKNALVKTSTEPKGTNCPNGGLKVESGIDADGNGTLEPGEVDSKLTTYVCNGGTPGPSGNISPSTGLKIEVKEVSVTAGQPITVRFLLKDDRGFPVDIAGGYSVNTPIDPRFAIGWFTKDAKGNVGPYNLYTKSISSSNPNGAPTAYRSSRASDGSIVENGLGAGDYTFTFTDKDAGATGSRKVAYDATKLGETHVVWIQATRQTDLVFTSNANTYFAANQFHYYIPNGTGTPLTREIVNTNGCYKCHDKFKPETTTSNQFHGGGRMDGRFCNVCHNPARESNPSADSKVFVHRIHNGQNLDPANRFHNLAAHYPQDIRNCKACHEGAAQGAQASANPTRAACGSCHDYVDFVGTSAPTCTNPPTRDSTTGLPIKCKHVGGQQTDDTGCANSSCHTPAKVEARHAPIVPPDPNNAWLVSGGNTRTNAAYVAAAGYVPQGAAVISYDIKSVEAVDDSAITPNKRPQITFKFKKNGTDVVFQTYSAGTTTEMIAGFIGAPSAYFAFSVPQDGKTDAPADFNATASVYLRDVWDGSATGSKAATLTGPDASGYYTLKLTGVQIPPDAKLLTGGIGYSYQLTTTPPLTQIDLPAFPYNTNGKKQGGLMVIADNQWKTATGYTARRPIVDNAKCKNCHAQLGVAPTFHVGARNNAPTCSFCHVPDRASSGWSAGSRYFIHAIHAGRKRTTPFTWHAVSQQNTFAQIGFPSPLNDCKVCHLPNTYDFTASANINALPNLALTTVASGKYNSNPQQNSNFYTLSPYVVADNVKDYGNRFSYSATTNAKTEAASTTLVISPITTVCSACHDSKVAIDHMKQGGGMFYAERSTALSASAPQEGCMICHGPGRIAAIGFVHQ